MIDDREVATLVWIGVALVFSVAVPKLRRDILPSLGQLVWQFFSTVSVVLVFALFFVWCAAWILLASLAGLWRVEMLMDSILTVIVVGLPTLVSTVKAKSGTAIMRRILGETVALSALVAFVVNSEPFPLVVELLLVPILVFLGGSAALANAKEEFRPARSCLNGLLVAVGLAMVVWAILRLFLGAETRDWGAFALELSQSIWLPLVMVPYFYGTAFFGAVEGAVKRMRRSFEPPALRRVAAAAVLGLHFRLKWARAFNYNEQKVVAHATGFRDGLRKMRDFREGVEHAEEMRDFREADLEGFAGQTGADANGAQIDRREFHGTKRALDFLNTAQGLRYKQLGDRYWNDLTEMVLQPTSRFGLPEAHGISVETTADGQRWRAWRRLPNGWFLGIGAKSGEVGHFLYSAGSAPDTWPGDDDWTDATWSPELPPDWERNDDPERRR